MSEGLTSRLNIGIFDVDWALNLRSVLERCDQVLVFPDQIVICPVEGQGRLSFVHGVPGASGLAGVNFAHDKRKRRALMEQAQVPIPRGATFRFGTSERRVTRFARRLLYPVTMKPALGDNGVDTIVGIIGKRGLKKGRTFLETLPEHRPHHVQSAYRMFLLNEPVMEDGEKSVPRGYQFIVEKHFFGPLYRVLVSAGRVVSAVEVRGSPSSGEIKSARLITGELPQEIAGLAVRAVGAVPGIDVAAVDIVKPIGSGILGRKPVVVEYHERPGLWVQEMVDTRAAVEAANVILEDYAAQEGVSLPPPSGRFHSGSPTGGSPTGGSSSGESGQKAFTFEINALPDPSLEARWLEELGEKFRVDATDIVVDEALGVVGGVLSGELLNIVGVINGLMEGTEEILGAPGIALVRMGS